MARTFALLMHFEWMELERVLLAVAHADVELKSGGQGSSCSSGLGC